mmetsp:Transcript_57085/g.68261  ORF Transcript_57085/g.68261 Transcript_57085/m.68261 type:complete len:82 (+) Transcript_57085:68-313(+)
MISRNLKTLRNECSTKAISISDNSPQTSKGPEKTKGDLKVARLAGITNKRKDSRTTISADHDMKSCCSTKKEQRKNEDFQW